jgi:hypothetical protein
MEVAHELDFELSTESRHKLALPEMPGLFNVRLADQKSDWSADSCPTTVVQMKTDFAKRLWYPHGSGTHANSAAVPIPSKVVA